MAPNTNMDPSITVLLVEDNPDDALLMQRAFKVHGLMRPPHICANGAEAIAYLSGHGVYADRTTHPFPNLLITDLKMPGSDGFEVLQWLRDHSEFTVIPTIVWSSSAELRDVKRAYCLGANGYLRKPTDFQEFKEMVADVLRYWDRCEKPMPNTAPPCADLASKSS